ncbi:hypothetical protein Tco_0653331 [Tanacetum coccineum]|uniref:Retrovirus-related Pol polyprotein from transposon TNT 1-94 n=1 Tax=Tanacetum coccineum TaxID=301880 RepID=A0ABQ4X028_9ASTR
MLLDSILYGLFQYKVVDFPANEAVIILTVTRMQTFMKLTPEEKIIKEYDIKAANIILHRLPNDIYTFFNHNTIAFEIWYMVKELMEGTDLSKQEKESKLAYEFDMFTSGKGETIQYYYMRFAKLINDINIIGLEMKPLQHNEQDANEVRAMRARFPYPLALIANTYNLPPSYSSFKSQYNPPMPVAAKQPYIQQPSYEPHAIYQ